MHADYGLRIDKTLLQYSGASCAQVEEVRRAPMCLCEECVAVECMQCHGCLAVAALAILPSRTDAVHHREHAEKCIFEHCSHPVAIISPIPSSFQLPCAFPGLPRALVAASFLDGFTGFQFSLYLTTDLCAHFAN